MKFLLEKIKTSLDKLNTTIVQKTQSQLLSPAQEKDLSCYYKLPMFFFETNNDALAKKILVFIYDKFLMSNGDFKTNDNLKSVKPEYLEYWTYFNGWILRSAYLLKFALPKHALEYFGSMYVGQGSFMTRPNVNNDEWSTDVLTIAHHGLFYLESDDIEYSHEAAKFLYLAFDSQKNRDHKFLLRFDKKKQPIDKYSTEEQLFFSVDKNKGIEQLYFMMAYPCAFLTLYYKKTGDKNALEYAKSYMDFIINCDKDMHLSRFSHKVAWAASLLYNVTEEQKYLVVVQKIVEFFISIQSANGLWFEEEGECVYFDQSAEIGCWFSQIMQNLYSPRLYKDSTYPKLLFKKDDIDYTNKGMYEAVSDNSAVSNNFQSKL